uniref:Uncharacterized protein n=3 Tax=Aegilops tauschii subsp. strangulata TaxID=200361 RepID=A0A453BEP3_AEGTS
MRTCKGIIQRYKHYISYSWVMPLNLEFLLLKVSPFCSKVLCGRSVFILYHIVTGLTAEEKIFTAPYVLFVILVRTSSDPCYVFLIQKVKFVDVP